MPNLQDARQFTFGTVFNASPSAGVPLQRPFSTSDNVTPGMCSTSQCSPGSHGNGPHSPLPGGHVGGLPQQQQLPPACGARQLSKLKRFLTTLQQFGADISPEIGDHVRALVLALVNSQLSIEEFHSKLQQATNFPLRPFVIPFLKANLPLLQRELLHCAQLARQSPHQYLMYNDRLVFESGSATASNPRSPPALPAPPPPPPPRRSTSPSSTHNSPEPSPTVTTAAAEKRKASSPERDWSKQQQLPGGLDGVTSTSLKRQRTVTPRSPVQSAGSLQGLIGGPPSLSAAVYQFGGPGGGGLQSVAGGPSDAAASTGRYDDQLALFRDLREINRMEREHGIDLEQAFDLRAAAGQSNNGVEQVHGSAERMSEDLKRVENLLQNVVGMVDKCKSAIKTLRDQWQMFALHSDVDSFSEASHRAVAEAVNEVKRKAIIEVQTAIAESELKASQLVAAERAKMELALSEARKQTVDEILSSMKTQQDSTETCWNCGRKASETCSGCNTARYCGSFCQHKDWEVHHKVCGRQAVKITCSSSSSHGGKLPTMTTNVQSTSAVSTCAPPTTRIRSFQQHGVEPPTPKEELLNEDDDDIDNDDDDDDVVQDSVQDSNGEKKNSVIVGGGDVGRSGSGQASVAAEITAKSPQKSNTNA